MSYQVLARKWRPQRFPDMLGQEPVLRALVNALDSGRLHHAYLFTGMRGVGKTSIARIFAKCLNCEVRGVSSSPCGECAACRDIEAGRFLDLIEVDAASRTKVEETRELLENVPYAPASGRYKVYLIDEVHMFSNSSFNALLKTLEEPPEHVKFLLATTDPQKVPVTVLSRCLQFNLRRMASDQLADYLASILEVEGIEAERAGLELIARASEGSVRDSLSLVEQAAALGEGAVRVREVESMLGRVSVERLLALLEALGEGDVATLFARVEELAGYAPDFGEMLGELSTLLHRLALAQGVPGGVDASVPGHAALQALAGRISPTEVQLWYQIGLHARRDLPHAPDPREAFDMALLRMHAFRPQRPGRAAPAEPVADVVAANPAVVDVAAANAAATGAAAPRAIVSREIAGATEAAVPVRPTPGLPVRGSTTPAIGAGGGAPAVPGGRAATPAPERVPTPGPVSAPSSAAGTAAGSAATPAGSLAAIVPAGWPRIVEALGLSGMPRQLAAHAMLSRVDGTRVTLALEKSQDHLNSPPFVERIRTALERWVGESVSIGVEVVDGTLDTPARRVEADRAAERDSARAAIDADENLGHLLAAVDGTIEDSSVRPTGTSGEPRG